MRELEGPPPGPLTHDPTAPAAGHPVPVWLPDEERLVYEALPQSERS